MKSHLNTILIAIAVVFAALIFASAIKNRNKSTNSISVTGLGEKDFVSDLIVWKGSFSKKNMNLKDACAALDQDRENIKRYLIGKGIKPSEIIFYAVSINKDYNTTYDQSGKSNSVFTGYQLAQSVQVESNEVDKIEGISRQVSELINSGVEFYSFPPEYYYTKLAKLKVEMIAEATKDASNRAKNIAENAGSNLGKLKNANMGVFQIVAQNSSEDFSWGGSFNTTSKKKTATITIKLEYGVD